MAQKEIVVQGALCQCNFGSMPDKLKVLTQSKHYANDYDEKDKLVATHKDIGQTFEKNTFGPCKMQPLPGGGFKPCQAVVTAWSGYYDKVTFEINKGHILLEDSKATCPIGGKDCITIIKSGQIAEPTKQNFRNADEELLSHVLPIINMSSFDSKNENKVEL